VSKRQKLLEHCRNNPKGVSYDDLVGLVKALGFQHDRTVGDHMIFVHPVATVPLVNLQRAKSGMAKPYQVRQVLDLIDAHGLEVK
jgi:predicted RNA binding protein YcfA (HicA-like mRNA interferase family)